MRRAPQEDGPGLPRGRSSLPPVTESTSDPDTRPRLDLRWTRRTPRLTGWSRHDIVRDRGGAREAHRHAQAAGRCVGQRHHGAVALGHAAHDRETEPAAALFARAAIEA